MVLNRSARLSLMSLVYPDLELADLQSQLELAANKSMDTTD